MKKKSLLIIVFLISIFFVVPVIVEADTDYRCMYYFNIYDSDGLFTPAYVQYSFNSSAGSGNPLYNFQAIYANFNSGNSSTSLLNYKSKKYAEYFLEYKQDSCGDSDVDCINTSCPSMCYNIANTTLSSFSSTSSALSIYMYAVAQGSNCTTTNHFNVDENYTTSGSTSPASQNSSGAITNSNSVSIYTGSNGELGSGAFSSGEVSENTCESGCTYSLSKSGYESVTINIYYNGSQWVKQFSADGVNVTTTSTLSVSILDNSSDENISYDIESSLLNASISTVYEATYYGYAKYTDTANVAKYKVCLASSASYCENSLKNYDEYCYYNGSTIVCYSSSSTTTSTEITDVDCDSILGSPKVDGSPAYYLTYAFKIIRYVAIILLIVLTVMDFLGPIASQDQDAIKKAVRKAVTRLVICIVIWLLPYLIEMVLELIHEAYTDFPECGVGIDY